MAVDPGHRPLLLTLGEPAGIGPDCALLLWQRAPEQFRDLLVVAPPAWIEARARTLGIDAPVRRLERIAMPPDDRAISCLAEDGWTTAPVRVGQPAPATAGTVIAAIRLAARACLAGQAAALVTGPIEKAVLREGGFAFPGHTEFLAHLCGDVAVVMMLAAPGLRVALLTTHMALRAVPDALDRAEVERAASILDRELRRRFSVARPRLALCALNPHGGERGHFGDEEERILAPAVHALQARGIAITGPLPADTLFAPPQAHRFDAILCCYHDQALIPLKMQGFGRSVNISLGLPIIRTSVDHGTALDRAGTGTASPDSLCCAIETARAMAADSERAA
ncbi:MAG: 4-hydroxythreonine-4-phosphate dehydrogenase PdxA [Zetaproteobacteria bacterium]|nr:MAG: 4-hydroxythreonine-4-phosphate dehydrogenase PdxA [Zetaproteobacteria bacterium]